MSDCIVIRGVAHRGASTNAEFVAGATPANATLPLYPQRYQHTSVGGGRVTVQDNGDVVAEMTIPMSNVSWLIGFPFLALAIDDPKDGPRQIVQVAVTDQVMDPLQLPYRIVDYPKVFEYELMHYYESVVEIDEPHDAQVQLGGDGSMHPVFDQAKSHIELRHRSERARLVIPDAIARGFECADWATISAGGEVDPLVHNVLCEVMRVL